MDESSSSSQSGADCAEQSSSSTGAASEETVELKGIDGANYNSHFSIRSRSDSTSSLFEAEGSHREVRSTVSPRSGKSSCLSENGGWHPGWVSVSSLTFCASSKLGCMCGCSICKFDSDGDTTNGGAPVWMELDRTDGLSLSTYSSPEQLPQKPEGVVSFCSSAARFFCFRALELGIFMPLTEEAVAQPVGIRTVPTRSRLNTR